ncbi:vacuolar protein-sorting protein, putative [Ixodes scapularis]|uniref:Vacuolar protein-sorting protein, putative n=1 Tax=Ixodes scapularis TaxID=6945 RepID=B7Q5G7_IXOSC|nr:vacuolar protein-sorting protein, putative [Ixodes scapularis]|eukprot:XP_002411760.1 vacuolar protein-sorting protein, putative [Ixodes scapularis]
MSHAEQQHSLATPLWTRCQRCPGKTAFKTPDEFARHLRDTHCSKEGGSFVCRYGNNDVCASLPLEGVSDEDYEAHVLKHHVLSQKEAERSDRRHGHPKDDSDSGRSNGEGARRATNPAFPDAVAEPRERWTIYHSAQNLPAVLNDPRRSRRESDFFIKTWGDHFTDTTPLPPCLHVPTISRLHFESYLARTSRRYRRHLRRASSATSATSDGRSGTLFGLFVFVNKHKFERLLSFFKQMFLKPDFSLEDPETFHTVIPWSVIQPSARKSKETLAPKQTSRLLQEKLSHYLDIVEVQIARQVSLKSDAFFQAMTSHDALSAKMTTTLQAVSSLRQRISVIDASLVNGALKVLQLKRLHANYIAVYSKLQLMATVHQAQPTIQRLLATSDFVRALDFIEATREILTLELAGVQSFRHLDCQLIEIEKVIDKMMQTDFLKYATADLNRPLADDVQVANEEHLVAVVFGMLRLGKQSFVDLYKEEACTAVKATVKQVDGFLDKLSSSSFVTLCKAVDSFTAQCNETCKHKSTVLLLALRTQADRFVSRFHEERKMKLSLLLDSEQWTRVDIPPEFQNMVNHVVDKDVLVLPEKELLRGDSSKGKPKGYLEINSEKYGIAGSAVMMLKMVLEYCQCAKDIPFVALNLLSKLQELLRNFNSRTSQLVLGAGALQLVGLKTITASVLALTARCLQLLLFFLPKVKTHFEVHLTTRREMAKHFDQIHKEYAEHVSEIFSKLAHIVGSVMDAQLNNWEVKAPVPSPAFRAVAKHLSKFHGAIAEVLSPSDVVMLLGWVHAAFTQSLRAHLTRLAVAKDGGPQHGLVTQELTFYVENLKSLGVPVTFDDLWQAR